MDEIRMAYRKFKKSYSDCDTLAGSYHKADKTIIVLIPEGRMKASGTRGNQYHYYTVTGKDEKGNTVNVTFKAICKENIKRQAKKYYPQITFDFY